MTINNNNIFGVFTLGEVRSGRLTGEWLNKESVANYGWFGGGANYPSRVSTVDRIDFSNDTGTANIRGPLSSVRYAMGATGNSNYGWFGGGIIPGPAPVSTVDRIDFSNDSSTASVRGSLSLARRDLAATGNSNYGWYGGGINSLPTPDLYYSTVDRIDFSNDSSTASVRGPLSASGYLMSATGNSNYGWFGNRTRNGGSTAITTIDRIDFSNDSVTSSPRGTTNTGRKSASATGNSNFGWWFGGSVSPGSLSAYSSVERINFSNDLATASLRGNLSAIRSNSAATGNSNYGWIGGNQYYVPPFTLVSFSTVDRIDFSNDSATASPRGPLSLAKSYLAATSNTSR